MDNLTSFLHKWQTLVGAFIGGIFALSVALIVAWDARRREEKASAMLLLTDLQDVKAASEALDEIMRMEETKPEEKARLIAIKLLGDRQGLSLSPLFESSMIRIMPVDDSLAAHLALFKKIVTRLNGELAELRRTFDLHRLGDRVAISKEELESGVQLINKRFRMSVEHTIWALYLLQKLVLGSTAPLHRIVRRVPVLKNLIIKREKSHKDLPSTEGNPQA
jgi:hypothetical protein